MKTAIKEYTINLADVVKDALSHSPGICKEEAIQRYLRMQEKVVSHATTQSRVNNAKARIGLCKLLTIPYKGLN